MKQLWLCMGRVRTIYFLNTFPSLSSYPLFSPIIQSITFDVNLFFLEDKRKTEGDIGTTRIYYSIPGRKKKRIIIIKDRLFVLCESQKKPQGLVFHKSINFLIPKQKIKISLHSFCKINRYIQWSLPQPTIFSNLYSFCESIITLSNSSTVKLWDFSLATAKHCPFN